MKRITFLSFCILVSLLIAAATPAAHLPIPVTGAASTAVEAGVEAAPRGLPTRISDRGVFSLQIVQQPTDDPGFVSRKDGTVTQFRLASDYGSKGFLAHNDLAGAEFFDVQVDDVITVTYSNGTSQTYGVTQIRHLQAVSPLSAWSKFLDLDNASALLTAVDLFYQTYGEKGKLILQTCIANGDEQSWGRLFIIAEPVTIVPNSQ